MSRYFDGLKVPTCLFEAAAWRYAVKVGCGCGHFAAFQPHGIWWHFHRKGWPDDFRSARSRMWCCVCRQYTGKKVRPRRLDAIRPYTGRLIDLPMPDEREWKRIVNRFRG
ncbi:hypothetical protein [Sphingobium sp. TomMM35A]